MPVNIFSCQRSRLLQQSANSLVCELLNFAGTKPICREAVDLVGPGGIEPPTSPLSGVRSSHLSYGPLGQPFSWWSWSGSNRRPPECKSGALPAELQPLVNSVLPLQEALPSRCNRGQLDTG